MLTAFLGFAYAMVLQQGDTFREHIQTEPIVLYSGDSNSWLYVNRQSRFVVGGVQWREGEHA